MRQTCLHTTCNILLTMKWDKPAYIIHTTYFWRWNEKSLPTYYTQHTFEDEMRQAYLHNTHMILLKMKWDKPTYIIHTGYFWRWNETNLPTYYMQHTFEDEMRQTCLHNRHNILLKMKWPMGYLCSSHWDFSVPFSFWLANISFSKQFKYLIPC